MTAERTTAAVTAAPNASLTSSRHAFRCATARHALHNRRCAPESVPPLGVLSTAALGERGRSTLRKPVARVRR